jgi:hypothetical protein
MAREMVVTLVPEAWCGIAGVLDEAQHGFWVSATSDST